MFASIWNWVRNRFASSPSQWDVYNPPERGIYSYFNGENLVKADPMLLYRRMKDRWSDMSVSFKVARSGSHIGGGYNKAQDDVIRYIREIFDLKEFANGGLTIAMCLDLLTHFRNYTETLKKNSRKSPIRPIATSRPSAPSLEENRGTPNSSDCGSTANAPSTADPLPSNTESASPLDSPPPECRSGIVPPKVPVMPS